MTGREQEKEEGESQKSQVGFRELKNKGEREEGIEGREW